MLERLWMAVHPQISLAFLAAFSRTRKIHLCVAESRAVSRHPTASNLSPNFRCTICVHQKYIRLLNHIVKR